MSNAETRENNDSQKPLSEVISELHPKARTLLSNINTAPTYQDGVHSQGDMPPAVQTSYLTSTTGLPNNLVTHHMQSLIRDGLAERIRQIESTDPASQPGPLGENVYQCTEHGVEAAELLDEQPVGESTDALHAEIERLREKQKWMTQVLMQVAVNTDTFSEAKAKEIMPPDQFEDVFSDDSIDE